MKRGSSHDALEYAGAIRAPGARGPSMADRRAALENLSRAHDRLPEFVASPVVTDRDKAGVT
jgi:hypothetical protein